MRDVLSVAYDTSKPTRDIHDLLDLVGLSGQSQLADQGLVPPQPIPESRPTRPSQTVAGPAEHRYFIKPIGCITSKNTGVLVSEAQDVVGSIRTQFGRPGLRDISYPAQHEACKVRSIHLQA